ncbi:MAG: hypothetical protein RR382_00010 [Tannerellaceae bacterium]
MGTILDIINNQAVTSSLGILIVSILALIIKKIQAITPTAHGPIGTSFSDTHIKIGDALTTLLEQTRADRATLYQFSNGEYFSTSNPMWKITCSVEKIEKGLAFESGVVCKELASSMLEFVAPIIDPSAKVPGVTVEKCGSGNCNLFKSGLKIRHYDIFMMPYCRYKRLMDELGTSHVYAVPMLVNNKTVGILAVQYMADTPSENIPNRACSICTAMRNVQFYLEGTDK